LPQRFQLVTERLLLRPWREEDYAPFAEMNADPLVRQYFAGTLTREESDREADYCRDEFDRNGYTFFAAEDRATGEFHGFIGLAQININIPGVPHRAVEIGWRLKSRSWNRGLATEGARAALDHALGPLQLPTIYAYTAVQNQPSRHVMEKLGLTYRPHLDFDHPRVPQGSPIRGHVLYSIANPQQYIS
jgi:RimJ/RimL family protein N-acetyltransferase